MCTGLVLTGGAIGSSNERGMVSLRADGMLVVDVTDRGLGDEAHLVATAWTGARRLDLRVRTPLRKLSENMTPNDWLAIATSVRELVEIEKATSVIIFHGTDTATYTAAALSFLLNDLLAPVVITGANYPTSDVNSDALTNTRDALIAAESLPPGVYISFAGSPDTPSEVHLGNRVRKVWSLGQPFSSPNHGPFARIVDGRVELLTEPPVRAGVHSMHGFSPDVAVVAIYPGIDLRMYADALISSGKRGVVVRLYSGICGPESDGNDSLPHFVQRCSDEGIVVVLAVDHFSEFTGAYPSFAASLSAGAVFAADIIPETAYVKLTWALGQNENPEEVRNLFLKNVAGESTIIEPEFVDLPESKAV